MLGVYCFVFIMCIHCHEVKLSFSLVMYAVYSSLNLSSDWCLLLTRLLFKHMLLGSYKYKACINVIVMITAFLSAFTSNICMLFTGYYLRC
jgi:hypothetical protein